MDVGKSKYKSTKKYGPLPGLPLSANLPLLAARSNKGKEEPKSEQTTAMSHDSSALSTYVPSSNREPKFETTDEKQGHEDQSHALVCSPLSSKRKVEISIKNSIGEHVFGEVIQGNEEKGWGRFKNRRLNTGQQTDDDDTGGEAFHGTLGNESYEGGFQGGFFQGHGIYRSAEGHIYIGDFSRGNFGDQGGVLKYTSGITYSGQFKNQLMHGIGECSWPDGNVYYGEWKDGLRDGVGRESYALNGTEYKGEWKYDKRNGFGTSVDQTGNSYKGGWANDQRHGYGLEINNGNEPTNQYIYQGGWKHNERDGFGVLCFNDGRIFEGIFKNGVYSGGISKSEKSEKKENVDSDNKGGNVSDMISSTPLRDVIEGDIL